MNVSISSVISLLWPTVTYVCVGSRHTRCIYKKSRHVANMKAVRVIYILVYCTTHTIDCLSLAD
jgi:hypothetical protein